MAFEQRGTKPDSRIAEFEEAKRNWRGFEDRVEGWLERIDALKPLVNMDDDGVELMSIRDRVATGRVAKQEGKSDRETVDQHAKELEARIEKLERKYQS